MDYKKISKLFAELSEEFAKAADPVKDNMAEPVSDVTAAEEADRKTLEKMSFNELKKYAKEHNIDAKGKREDIIARILGDEAEEPKKSEKKSEKKTEKKPEKKSNKDNVLSFDEKAEDVKKSLEMADELLDEYEEDSIIDELKEVGMKGVTKKTLRDKLAEAIRKGLIDLDDEDESEDDDDEDEDMSFDADESGEESDEDESDDDEDEDEDDSDDDESDEDEEEIDENTYFEDYDDGANDPANVKKTRLKAMVALQKSLIADIGNEDLDIDTMKSFVLENSTEDEQEEVEQFDDDDIIATYIELRKRMIDDEGDDMSGEDDPYEVNGEVYAHGHLCPCEDGVYVDEVSGDTFELE